MSSEDQECWQQYFSYLRGLLDLQVVTLPTELRAAIDLSGVVQQTLLEAHQMSLGANATVTLPWLRRVLANNLTDEIRRLRSGKRDVRRLEAISRQFEQSSVRLEKFLANQLSGPADQALKQERVLRLMAALQELPESQRQALILQVWEGWSLTQIAEEMGRTRVAVAGLLKRGLQRLRELLIDLTSNGG